MAKRGTRKAEFVIRVCIRIPDTISRRSLEAYSRPMLLAVAGLVPKSRIVSTSTHLRTWADDV